MTTEQKKKDWKAYEAKRKDKRVRMNVAEHDALKLILTTDILESLRDEKVISRDQYKTLQSFGWRLNSGERGSERHRLLSMWEAEGWTEPCKDIKSNWNLRQQYTYDERRAMCQACEHPCNDRYR